MKITHHKFGISFLYYAILLISIGSCATTFIKGSGDEYVSLSGAVEEIEMLTAAEANVPFPRKYDTDVRAENLQRDATEESFKDSNGFIPVVVVVSVVVVVLIVALSCCCYRRRKAKKKNAIDKDIQDAVSIESEEVHIPVPMPKDNMKPLKIVLMNKPDQKKLEQKPSQPLKDAAKVDQVVVIPVPSHGKETAIEHPKLEIANELLDTKSDKVHVENEVLDQKREILDAGPAIMQQDNETLRSNSVASTDSGGIQVTVNHEDHVTEDKDSLHDDNKDLDEKVNEVLSDIDEILSVHEDKLDAESRDESRAESLQDVGSALSEVKNDEKDDVSDRLEQISTTEPSLQEQEHEKSDSDNDEPSVKEAIAESSEVAAFIEEHQEQKPHLDKEDKEEKDEKEDKEDKQSISSDENETEDDNLNTRDSVANESDRDNENHENPNVSRDSNEKDPEAASISH